MDRLYKHISTLGTQSVLYSMPHSHPYIHTYVHKHYLTFTRSYFNGCIWEQFGVSILPKGVWHGCTLPETCKMISSINVSDQTRLGEGGLRAWCPRVDIMFRVQMTLTGMHTSMWGESKLLSTILNCSSEILWQYCWWKIIFFCKHIGMCNISIHQVIIFISSSVHTCTYTHTLIILVLDRVTW